MSVRMHITRGKTGSRRAHHRASSPSLTEGTEGPRRRHFVDPATGEYRGKKIKDLVEKNNARTKRREKRIARAGGGTTTGAKASRPKIEAKKEIKEGNVNEARQDNRNMTARKGTEK